MTDEMADLSYCWQDCETVGSRAEVKDRNIFRMTFVVVVIIATIDGMYPVVLHLKVASRVEVQTPRRPR